MCRDLSDLSVVVALPSVLLTYIYQWQYWLLITQGVHYLLSHLQQLCVMSQVKSKHGIVYTTQICLCTLLAQVALPPL